MKQLGRGIQFLAVLALVAGLAAGGAALAVTVTIPADRDNTLYENAGGLVSNGSGDYIFSGVTAVGGLRRALVRFDVAGNVPAGATIDSVSLDLYMSMTIAGPQDTGLHRIQADWGEGASDAGGEEGGGTAAVAGDATWLHTFFNGSFWGSAGGDYAGAASATTPVGFEGSYTWGSTAQMVADVQSWLDAPGGNHGWAVIGNESVDTTAKRFNSRSNAQNQPALTIDYTPDGGEPSGVPTVSEWGLILMTLLLLSAATLVFGRRAATPSTGTRGAATLGFGGIEPLFAPRIYLAALGAVLGLVALGFAAAVALLGELSSVDVVGSLLAAPILAYLLHLWARPRE